MPDTTAGRDSAAALVPDAPPVPPPMPVLVLVTALGPLALHMVLPALPEVAQVFAIPDNRIGYIVTAYLGGFALAQLAVGPLSDRFGRRPVVLAGLCLFLAATALCLAAPSAAWLFVARTVQALGGCAGMVLGRAILRDCYARDMTASRMGYLVTAMALGTMMAPGIGAVIVAFAGWRGVFVALALLAAAAITLAVLFLGETNRNPLARLNVATLVRNYSWLLGSRAFLGHALNTGCQNGVWFAFVTVMPVALVAVYGRPATEYGLWILLPMAGYVGSSYLAGRLSARVGTAGMIRAGMGISALGLMAVSAAALFTSGPAPIFAALALYVVGNGIALPSITASALSVNPAITGSAAGMLGFVQWTTGMAATAAVSIAGLSDVGFLEGLIVVIGGLSFLTLLLTRR